MIKPMQVGFFSTIKGFLPEHLHKGPAKDSSKKFWKVKGKCQDIPLSSLEYSKEEGKLQEKTKGKLEDFVSNELCRGVAPMAMNAPFAEGPVIGVLRKVVSLPGYGFHLIPLN